MRTDAVRQLVPLFLFLAAGCTNSGAAVTIPTTAGTFSLVVDQGVTTPYSGPSSFSDDAGTLQIICWSDSTFSAPLVTLSHAGPVTGQSSWDVVNPATAASDPGDAPTYFVVTDNSFTSPTVTPFGGNILVVQMSATAVTAQFGYSDGTSTVNGATWAIPR